jgi:IMP dehydrogenase
VNIKINKMAKEIILKPSHSLKEFRLLTGKTDLNNVMNKISLKTKLCAIPNSKKHIELNIPLVSAAMQAVSGKHMAVALAQLGGISVIPCSIPIEDQVKIVSWVKRFKAGFQPKVITVSKEDKISNVMKIMKKKGYGKFPVTVDAKRNGKLLGIITSKNFDPKKHKSDLVKDHMVKKIITAKNGTTLSEANDILVKHGVDVLPIIDKDHNLVSIVFKKDMEKHLDFPNSSIDDYKRYLVAGAVSTQPSDYKRIDALIEASVDVIFIDASDGFSQFQVDTIKYVRDKSPSIPIVGGNVISAEGFNFLAKAGFDGIKIGMGIGSGCTTQAQKGTGRGQATSIIDVTTARDKYFKKTGKYVPIISDGSISNSGQIMIALGLGADNVMMGRFFAQFTEAAGGLKQHPTKGPLKEYWMEASARAKNYGRYDSTSKSFFEEGVEGFVSHVGSLYYELNQTILKMKSSMSSTGCQNINELHKNAVLELQSESALRDSDVHDIISK